MHGSRAAPDVIRGGFHGPVPLHRRHHRPHPDRAPQPGRSRARHGLRQDRVLQSRRFGEGSPGPGDRARCRAARRACARGYHRRGHFRQYRRGAGDGGRGARLSLRRGDDRNLLDRAPQADARLWCPGDPDSRRRAHHRRGGEGARAGRKARLVSRRPVRESGQPRLPPPAPPAARSSRTSPAAGSTASSPAGAPAAPSPAWAKCCAWRGRR